MTNVFRFILVVIAGLAMFSCGENDAIGMMDNIKAVGDKNPKLAMKMLDSMYADVVNATEYTKMKYELLRVRINDKNYIVPNSNKMAEALTDYFSHNGTSMERQEAFFYAGSVYRDLDDTPRAIENFYKSIEAKDEDGGCDSVLLRNAYSNLYCLFVNVQDDSTALKMAKIEYAMSRAMSDMPVNTIMHLGTSLFDTGCAPKAKQYLDEALDSLRAEESSSEDNYIYMLLYYYSKMKLNDKANECYNLIRNRGLMRDDAFALCVYGSYYELLNQQDSAIACYKRALCKGDEYAIYDVSKDLFRIYSQKGNIAEANRYGAEFIGVSKKLDLVKNQKLAATVNNKYKYHLDESHVRKMKHERLFYMRVAASMVVVSVLLAFVFVVLLILKKNSALKKQLALAEEISSIKTQYRKVQDKLSAKTLKIDEMKAELATSTTQLQSASAELDRYAAALKRAHEDIEDKRRQSQSLMQMLHCAELSAKAEDVIVMVKNAAKGKRKLKAEDWRQLYAAIDNLQPKFRTAVADHFGVLSEQQMQVCCLMYIGLNNPQICNVSDIPRTTVWRWTKAYDWIYGQDYSRNETA